MNKLSHEPASIVFIYSLKDLLYISLLSSIAIHSPFYQLYIEIGDISFTVYCTLYILRYVSFGEGGLEKIHYNYLILGGRSKYNLTENSLVVYIS